MCFGYVRIGSLHGLQHVRVLSCFAVVATCTRAFGLEAVLGGCNLRGCNERFSMIEDHWASCVQKGPRCRSKFQNLPLRNARSNLCESPIRQVVARSSLILVLVAVLQVAAADLPHQLLDRFQTPRVKHDARVQGSGGLDMSHTDIFMPESQDCSGDQPSEQRKPNTEEQS